MSLPDYIVSFPEDMTPSDWNTISVAIDNLREARRIGDPLVTIQIVDYLRSRGATVTVVRPKPRKPLPALVRRAWALHR